MAKRGQNAGAEKPTENVADERRGRQPAGQAPMCPYCNVVCESKRSEPFFTRYYCPKEGCSFSQKVPRPTIRKERDAVVDQDELAAR